MAQLSAHIRHNYTCGFLLICRMRYRRLTASRRADAEPISEHWMIRGSSNRRPTQPGGDVCPVGERQSGNRRGSAADIIKQTVASTHMFSGAEPLIAVAPASFKTAVVAEVNRASSGICY